MRCVVFGATGYLGARLVPELLSAGHEVRVMARTPAKLDDVPWRSDVEVVEGDVTDGEQVRKRWTASRFSTTWCTRCWARISSTSMRAPHRSSRTPPRKPDCRASFTSAASSPSSSSCPTIWHRAPKWAGLLARVRRSHRGIARGGHHRSGVGQLRDAAVSDRATAADGHAEVAAHPGSAHRGARRAVLPDQRGRAAGRCESGLRYRRPRHIHLHRDEPQIRGDRGPAQTCRHPGAGADSAAVVALGEPDHPAATVAGVVADGLPGKRRGVQRARHRRAHSGPRWWLDALRRRRRIRVGPGARRRAAAPDGRGRTPTTARRSRCPPTRTGPVDRCTSR